MQHKLLQPVFLILSVLTLLVQVNGQTIQYGFQQDPKNPYQITAVAIPDFSSDNVTISTALFTFAIPELSIISPEIAVVPKTGSFHNHSGVWAAQKITPTVYDKYGFDAKALKGNSLYQVVLQNSPSLDRVRAGVPIPLFSFELVNDFQKGKLEVLRNDGPLRNAIYKELHANFNNQISMSVDDAPSIDIYDKKEPFMGTVSFPIKTKTAEHLPAEGVRPHLSLQPNPATYQVQTTIQSIYSGMGDVVFYDVQQNEVLRRTAFFEVGANIFSFELDHLPAGMYLLLVKLEDMVLQKKFVKIRQ